MRRAKGRKSKINSRKPAPEIGARRLCSSAQGHGGKYGSGTADRDTWKCAFWAAFRLRVPHLRRSHVGIGHGCLKISHKSPPGIHELATVFA